MLGVLRGGSNFLPKILPSGMYTQDAIYSGPGHREWNLSKKKPQRAVGTVKTD